MTFPLRSRALSTPWFPIPGHIEPNIHLFVIGDVQGHADTLLNILLSISDTPRKARHTGLVFTGNVIGLNQDIQAATDLAIEARSISRTDFLISLPGSNEITLAQAILDPVFMMDAWHLASTTTANLEHVLDAPDTQRHDIADHLRSQLPDGWAEGVMDSKGWWSCGDALFVHAGIEPRARAIPFLQQRPFDSAGSHWAWITHNFLTWKKGWNEHGFDLIVHGHSPAVPHWISNDTDMARLAPLHHQRLQLAAGSPATDQVVWAELVGNMARVHCQQSNFPQ